MSVRIAPSILSADFAALGDAVRLVSAAGADCIHVDVMDGRFVPNITIGIPVVAALRRVSSLPLDVHLMIVEPERYVEDFVEAGAASLSVHVEATPHLHRCVHRIRQLGARAGARRLGAGEGSPWGALVIGGRRAPSGGATPASLSRIGRGSTGKRYSLWILAQWAASRLYGLSTS